MISAFPSKIMIRNHFCSCITKSFTFVWSHRFVVCTV